MGGVGWEGGEVITPWQPKTEIEHKHIWITPTIETHCVECKIKYSEKLERENHRLREVLRDLSIRHEQRYDESVCECAEHRVACKLLKDYDENK